MLVANREQLGVPVGLERERIGGIPLDEAAAGNMVGATQKLRSAATRLLDMGELDLAETMNRAADTMTSGSGPSAADQKQITYATRRLTLNELTSDLSQAPTIMNLVCACERRLSRQSLLFSQTQIRCLPLRPHRHRRDY